MTTKTQNRKHARENFTVNPRIRDKLTMYAVALKLKRVDLINKVLAEIIKKIEETELEKDYVESVNSQLDRTYGKE